jgi:putative ubiquitin-RnfH superfamily antitoxin RatB of RatAB toxin-antitoxin module
VINVSLVYSPAPDAPLVCLSITLNKGSTIQDALQAVNWSETHPEAVHATFGIYGHKVSGDHILTEGDRIEIYRPLICDPKQARKNRAKLSTAKK